MRYYISNATAKFEGRHAETEVDWNAEMSLIKIYPDIKEQKITGFGGAMTEASAYVFSRMSNEKQKELLELYFGETGNQYNFARLPIQSCDFSLGNRSYVEEGDEELKSFSIAEDFRYQIPLIKKALEKNKEIQFLASPWSPPAFMKTNNDMNHGGKLIEKYYSAWAKLMVKYLLAYRAEGIVISRITVQNEPAAEQEWDSCLYTGEEEGIFAVCHLRKELDKAGLTDVKILIWDHNKDQIIERCEQSFAVEGAKTAIAGIAYHWYSGDHFEALQYVSRKYPDKEIIFTEGCVEYSRFAASDQTENAEMYAHNIIGDLNAGMSGFLDWNLLLDHQGGPNHVYNFCDAPIMCNCDADTIDVKLSYYYIGHFSRFIKPGAVRLLTSSYNKALECAAFENPDGERLAVILNAGEEEQVFSLYMEGKATKMYLEGHSIMTAVI